VQILLLAGGLEWFRTLATISLARRSAGLPYLRLAVILGAVTCVTAGSALVFRSATLRERYGMDGGLGRG